LWQGVGHQRTDMMTGEIQFYLSRSSGKWVKVLEPLFADLREHKTLYTKFFQDAFIRSFVSPFNTKQSSVRPHFCCLDSVFIILS
jgi:hypothetical protein